jgi:ubiquinone/menaquinone biosynthesis C-methylase UbiE
VVDLGTGTGRFALAAARRFGHVTAVDVSPAMLALLRERAADAGLGNLDCVRAGLPMLAATGFEMVAAQFRGRLYGAYTCVKR